ncbi:family 43 glycosylhydrolase [Terrimonas alba]|uniref:family 43 glycosylhydrolase n=1 Tax=Terrimonas alba TaxID=3349636 RepID=UPI0035F31C69
MNNLIKREVKKVLCFSLLVLASLFSQAQEFPKAILQGDYPDPSIIRDGEDYYMTHSPFYYAPGFLIWHSKDLMNWEPVGRAITQYEGSAMAPDLVKYKGKYYIYYPAANTNWVVWADNIKGPWSKPIDLKVAGIDPGHVTDEKGSRYLYVNEGEMIQLTEDGLATVGQKKKMYEGWVYPKSWVTECMCLESPKLNYHNGYYYMTSAQGGTAGPATSHMVVSARSKSIFGPWENSPYNPIVHTYSADDNWWSKGHGTLIDDVNGNWWMVYHAYANGYHTLGRQTLIEPIEWTSDGWFRTKATNPPIKSSTSIKHGLELSDDFKSDTLGIQWTFWKEYALQFLAFKQQSLFVEAKGTTPADGRILLTTVTDKNYETQVEVTAGKGNAAGLILYYNEKAYAGLISDGSWFTVYKNAKDSLKVPNKIGKHFFVKIQNRGNNVRIGVSKDGVTWSSLIEDLDVSSLHHNNYHGFYALRIGLLSAGKGTARFNQFRYRNAVPQEKDMSAYLMVFHKDETHGLYMALSPDGYNFTALNNGKPVIAGDTIAMQKGIRDPHIFRGPDGGFYLAMTDLHVFAKRDGLRDTEWERDGKQYGWGNNRGLVLMKSWDLINWKRTNIRFDTLSGAFSEIGCAWAPETIYDEKKGKLMIYFTMRFKNEANKLYYVYVNDAFDKIETMPQLLFQYPDPKVSSIDADITKVGDKYRMFYVSHDGQAGIRQAVSDKINSDYQFDTRWYDPEKVACEAPNVWKRIGEKKWVLMYDVYGLTPHNFGFSETSDFVNFTDIGHFNEGVMKTTNFTASKHGAIIHLKKEEAAKLAQHWGLSYDTLTEPNKNNPVLKGSYADPEILYAEKNKKYYIYPTSDGFTNWSGTYFKTFSSSDLKNWKDEGVILDLKKDVSWTQRNAWAPSIIEKKDKAGNYKYYYYYTAGQKIGVAVADNPTGPFKDSGKPLIDKLPEGIKRGQNIDPDVFADPKTGKTYLYWGNAFMAVCELNDDMVSIKPNTTRILISNDQYYSEGTHVFYRDGFYYFMWSKNDTRSPDYQVRYLKSASPVEPIDPSKGEIILSKDANKGIFATGHHSVLQVPGKDEWYIIYHRFKRPGGIYMGQEAGYNREVCIDKMEFNGDGNIIKVVPTL